jgi:radical SAM protein with 4Fe4S-binding SPASM domain
MLGAVRRLRLLAPDARADLFRAHARGESPWIVSAKLKLVDACNLRCFMCDYWKLRRVGELATEEVRAVLDDLAALGCGKVHFTGGEIFLRRDALDLFRYAAQLGMRVNLTTNGTLLDKAKVRALADVPVRSVTLSIDSPVARVHDEVRGRAGSFDETLATLDLLLRHRKKKTRLRLNSVVSGRTYRSLVEMPELLRERSVDGWLLIPMDPKGSLQHAMTRADILRYNAEIAPILSDTVRVPGFSPWVFGRTAGDAADGERHLYARGYYREGRCFAPWFHTLVNATGDVYPCCMGHRELAPLGNVRTTPLREIFRGEAYAAFRRKMTEVREAICHRCDDFVDDNRAIARAMDA